jgi:hypothetical protein
MCTAWTPPCVLPYRLRFGSRRAARSGRGRAAALALHGAAQGCACGGGADRCVGRGHGGCVGAAHAVGGRWGGRWRGRWRILGSAGDAGRARGGAGSVGAGRWEARRRIQTLRQFVCGQAWGVRMWCGGRGVPPGHGHGCSAAATLLLPVLLSRCAGRGGHGWPPGSKPRQLGTGPRTAYMKARVDGSSALSHACTAAPCIHWQKSRVKNTVGHGKGEITGVRSSFSGSPGSDELQLVRRYGTA